MGRPASPAKPLACPCGLPGPYDSCCGRLHAGAPAPTPERLMRSRYAAYALGLERYLLDTWHPSTRPAALALDQPPAPKWIGLQVLDANERGDEGVVEFVARYKVGGKAERLRERSRFVREGGRWLYLDGDSPSAVIT